MKWENVTIGQLVEEDGVEIQTGPFGTQLKASDYVVDGIPVINVRNIGYGLLQDDKLEFISDQTAERLGRHLLMKDDIVFGRKGAVDRHLLVRDNRAGYRDQIV
jgi:type I restriction enzyme S subunit